MRQATDTATLAPPKADDAEMTDEEPVNDAVKVKAQAPDKVSAGQEGSASEGTPDPYGLMKDIPVPSDDTGK
jgi:hypothetical protein